MYQPAPIYSQPRPVKVTYRPRWHMFASGLALWMTFYFLDVAVTYGVSYFTERSWIPVVGPLLQLETAPDWGVGLVVIDFAMQTLGMVLAIVGLADWKKVITYADIPAPQAQNIHSSHAPRFSAGFLASFDFQLLRRQNCLTQNRRLPS